MTHTQRSVEFLGCGTSMGVPMIGCSCAVCRSSNPKNQRYRPSVLVRLPAGNILIDTTPELRLQLVRAGVGLVHSVLMTHYHADHLFGLDDVRPIPHKLGSALPLYCHPDTEAVIRQTFGYAFGPPQTNPQLVVPRLELCTIPAGPFELLGETITPIPLNHNKFHVYGFRFGNLAYCTDVSSIPDASLALLRNLDTLILDCLRPGTQSHPSHLCLADALAVVELLKPKATYLTHMSHQWDYDAPPPMPSSVAMAYDGLRIDF